MANIDVYLAAILSAVYGEDVRGSIHDAIEIINDVSEVVLSTGTAVDSASSSSTGFFDDSLYLNTDTYELWKCVGTDTWQSLGVLKGAQGDPGADGNRWFRGTGISGKAVNPTVYSGSGITDANENDFYLNPSEGAVYHCVTGGDASTATWSYDFTMTGGGGGGTVVGWNQIQTSTGATKIAEITLDGVKTDVYAPTGGGGASWGGISGTLSDQTDLQNALNAKAASTDIHNGSLSIQQNGVSAYGSGQSFDANSSSNATANIITDDWVATASVSSGSVTFSGIDDSGNYGYEVFFNITSSSTNKNPTAQLSTISGEGTSSMSLTYTTDADDGTNNAKLRRIK